MGDAVGLGYSKRFFSAGSCRAMLDSHVIGLLPKNGGRLPFRCDDLGIGA